MVDPGSVFGFGWNTGLSEIREVFQAATLLLGPEEDAEV